MSHDPSQPRRLTDLLAAVIELDATARKAWLRTHCDDPAARAEVEALCRDDCDRHGPLDRSVDLLAGRLIDVEDDGAQALLGSSIGAWRVIELLGEGGMAKVWLAERCDGHFEQQVAVKCLKTALAGPAYARLFDRERQILATLEHPGIAHLLDGGVTDEGVPYIVMERVQGESLLKSCDARGLNLRQRLRLFARVCDIVQYAHQKLVVHRDLKPGNILIDNEGRPRLLDFGVAGLIDEASGDGASTRAVALTPGYAAPELLDGQTAGVAADVYSLGVILCELLTSGRRPQIGRGDDPATRPATWPSRLVGDASGGDPAWTRRRARQLRGDLDAIVLKCLRQDPSHRHASVADLAHDLRNHLHNKPVRARRGSYGYRAGLFLRRHAAALSAAAMVLVVLLAALLVTVQQNRRISAALAESEAVQGFVTSLFESNLPAGAASTLPTTAELLERGAERARTEFADNPALRVTMLTTIGAIYRRLDRHESAHAVLDQAMRTAAAQNGAGHPVALGGTQLQLGLLLYQQGQRKEAAAMLVRALDSSRQEGAGDHDIAVILGALGWVRSELGDDEQAIALQREAVAMAEDSKDFPLDDLADLRNTFGVTLLNARRYDDAARVLRRALAEKIELHGRVHNSTNTTAANLAAALDDGGHDEEGLRLLREVVATDRLIFKVPNRRQAKRLSSFGTSLYRAGHTAESIKALEEARTMVLAIHGSARGETHPIMANIKFYLGSNEYRLGHYAAAENWHRQALAQFRTWPEARRYYEVAATSVLARTLTRVGKWREARALAESALAMKEALRGASDRSLTPTLLVLARIERHEGHLDAARTHLRRALVLEGEARRDSSRSLTLRTNLALIDCLEGHPEQALAGFAAVLASPALGEGKDPLSRAATLSSYGNCLQQLGRAGEARTAWQQALELRRGRLPDDYPDSARIRGKLAQAL